MVAQIRDFVVSLPDGGLKEELYAQLRGSGAFRRFMNCVNYHRIEKQWYILTIPSIQIEKSLKT